MTFRDLIPSFPFRKQLVVLTLFHSLVLTGMIFFVEPKFVKNIGWNNSYLPFLYLLLTSIFFLIWSVTGRWKRSLLWAGIASVTIWLRMNQLDGVINLLLLLSFGCVWEYYWKLNKPHNTV